MAALRYLVFAVVGVVIASALFLTVNLIVSANVDAGVDIVERMIRRATCDEYSLEGTVRGTTGRPVAFAVVEVSYGEERLTTRSNNDGTFALSADEPVCGRRSPTGVQLVVIADNFRPKRQALGFNTRSIEVTLDARDFRP